jgi:hypothetical protein
MTRHSPSTTHKVERNSAWQKKLQNSACLYRSKPLQLKALTIHRSSRKNSSPEDDFTMASSTLQPLASSPTLSPSSAKSAHGLTYSPTPSPPFELSWSPTLDASRSPKSSPSSVSSTYGLPVLFPNARSVHGISCPHTTPSIDANNVMSMHGLSHSPAPLPIGAPNADIRGLPYPSTLPSPFGASNSRIVDGLPYLTPSPPPVQSNDSFDFKDVFTYPYYTYPNHSSSCKTDQLTTEMPPPTAVLATDSSFRRNMLQPYPAARPFRTLSPIHLNAGTAPPVDANVEFGRPQASEPIQIPGPRRTRPRSRNLTLNLTYPYTMSRPCVPHPCDPEMISEASYEYPTTRQQEFACWYPGRDIPTPFVPPPRLPAPFSPGVHPETAYECPFPGAQVSASTYHAGTHSTPFETPVARVIRHLDSSAPPELASECPYTGTQVSSSMYDSRKHPPNMLMPIPQGPPSSLLHQHDLLANTPPILSSYTPNKRRGVSIGDVLCDDDDDSKPHPDTLARRMSPGDVSFRPIVDYPSAGPLTRRAKTQVVIELADSMEMELIEVEKGKSIKIVIVDE